MTDVALRVTSHVGRDLLQSAQLFRHEHAVVWEYVSNGLQYKDPGTKPTVVVKVDVKSKKIQISDNGRGMLIHDLKRYFQMHGENLDRKEGRPGRGYFGTGKSAAFGIAKVLRMTTVRDKKRSRVELTRKEIEARSEGDEIPVRILENEVKTSAPNGTVIEIEQIILKQIDIGSIVRHIERHIAHWPDATVIVNNHECEFIEPDISREETFSTKGTEYEEKLGEAVLKVKVAKTFLEEERRGIAILSEGVWHETTLAGCERKPFAEYLFGTFDVLALGRDQSSPPAFDMSRSMKLNPRNETVAEIIRFVGVHLETIRKDLEKHDRERRQSEEQKRLQKQGSKIAELINQHFKTWREKLRHTIAKAGTGKDLLPNKDENAVLEGKIEFGDELPAIIVGASFNENDSSWSEAEPGSEPSIEDAKIKLDEKSEKNLAKRAQGNSKENPAGGFNVVFEKIGINEKRAKYDRESRTIYVNLEHPRIALELKSATGQSPVDDPNFIRMAYEIAFTEYAIVLAQELSSEQYYLDPQDALFELRQTLDDLSKAFALVWGQPGRARS
jgi:histidine kinase/DNA gyrase B/HSP90-like ATPase